MLQGGDDLHGFAQPHVVSDQGAQPERQVLHEPRVASGLVRTQLARKRRGHRHVLGLEERRKLVAKALARHHLDALHFARQDGAQLVPDAQALRGRHLASNRLSVLFREEKEGVAIGEDFVRTL